jgi:geranylgeranyl pyrophosphate synthase
MDWLTSLYPEVKTILRDAIPDYWLELAFAFGDLFEDPILVEAALPLASCRAVDGQARDATYVAAALLAAEVSLRIFDDLADQDRAGALWQRVGVGRAANYAAAAHTISFDILGKAPLPPEVLGRIRKLFIDTYLRIAVGQERDFVGTTKTVDDYWLMMELKTASAYAAACMSGAMVGTEDPEMLEACRAFGHHVGLVLQIFNDLESIWQPDGVTDLQQGKVTLPLLYGLQFDHPRRDELQSLIDNNQLVTQAARVREILDYVDARSFLIWAALKEREQAIEAIGPCPNSEGKEALESFLTGMFGDIDQF